MGMTRLRNDHLQAEVSPLGAELVVLRDAQGRDLLWDGDPAFWKGRAPLLFQQLLSLRLRGGIGDLAILILLPILTLLLSFCQLKLLLQLGFLFRLQATRAFLFGK